jgi:hypothetical protein
VAVVHDTASSALSFAPEGFGDGWTVQDEPLRTSTSDRASVPLVENPTAVQAEPVHDTPKSGVPSEPAGFDTDWIVQLEPFQLSARGRVFDPST